MVRAVVPEQPPGTRSRRYSLPREQPAHLRVLVADDSAVARLAIRQLLRSDKIADVVLAADGVEAVRLAVATAPDVAILDYGMPQMNGIAAARLIRQSCPGIPLILLTVSTAEYVIVAALAAGIRGYVLKADAGDDLMRAIAAVGNGATYVSPSASRILYECYLPKLEPA